MPIFVSGNNSKEFTPAPAGTHQAVCVDVVDLGVEETQWGKKHKVRIKWQIDEDMESGKPFLVQKKYTASLHEKANLRHDLESWRGRAFTESELAQFDLENLIGANCLVNIIHKPGSKGGTFANIASIGQLVKGMPKMTSREYTRDKDRTDTPTPDETRDYDGRDDDSIPF
jgi:hypothetical protein